MTKKFLQNLPGLVFILALLLSACGPQETPAPTADINAIYTQAAATIAVSMAQTAQAIPSATLVPPTATATVTPTFAPLPTRAATQTVVFVPPAPSGPTAIPVNTATANGCYNSTLIADATIPSGTKFSVGDTFTKTWLVKNTGTCDWNSDFKIAFVGGDAFGTDTTKIRQKVGVGATVEISLGMTAPNASGVSESYWQMVSDDGKYFGQVLGVSIVLPGGSAATSTTSPSSSATPNNSGCYQSTLISESIPSGTKMSSGDTFTETWEIKNTGSCAWNGDFKITFVGGDVLGTDTTKIRQDVEPGGTATISLDMIAPSASGTATSSWQLATDSGTLFGSTFTIKIVVK